MSRKVTDLQPWECLMKRIVWKRLGDIRNKKILDFGSGIGVTANYLAEHNDVTAIEPLLTIKHWKELINLIEKLD